MTVRTVAGIISDGQEDGGVWKTASRRAAPELKPTDLFDKEAWEFVTERRGLRIQTRQGYRGGTETESRTRVNLELKTKC